MEVTFKPIIHLRLFILEQLDREHLSNLGVVNFSVHQFNFLVLLPIVLLTPATEVKRQLLEVLICLNFTENLVSPCYQPNISLLEVEFEILPDVTLVFDDVELGVCEDQSHQLVSLLGVSISNYSLTG